MAQAKANQDSPRGSTLLKQRYGEAELKELIEVGERHAKLVDFFPIGIPAPDGGWGVWRVKPEIAHDLIRDLLKLHQVPGLRIFPKGIPFPEEFEVIFEAGAARRM
jgi:hypothetical protein